MQNSWVEWSNPLYMIAYQKNYFHSYNELTWTMSSESTGIFYPIYLFYGPLIFAIGAVLPLQPMTTLVVMLISANALGALGIALIVKDRIPSRRLIFALVFFGTYNFWNAWNIYRNAMILMNIAGGVLWLGLGLLSIGIMKNKKKYFIYSGIVIGLVAWIHNITFYILTPLAFLILVLFHFANGEILIRERVKSWILWLLSLMITASPISMWAFLYSGKTVAGVALPLQLSPSTWIDILWQPVTNFEIFIPATLFIISVFLIWESRQKKLMLVPGLGIFILLFILLFRTNHSQGLWNLISFISARVQFPDRFLFLINILMVLSLIICFSLKLEERRSRILSGALMALLIFNFLQTANLSIRTQPTYGEFGKPNVGKISEGQASSIFTQHTAVTIQYLMPYYKTYFPQEGEISGTLGFKLTGKAATHSESNPGVYESNLVSGPWLRCENAKILGTNNVNGMAILEVLQRAPIICKFRLF